MKPASKSSFLFIVVFVSMLWVSPPARAFSYGDLDGDGKFTPIDLQCYILLVYGSKGGLLPDPLPECVHPGQKCLADLNCDGKYNEEDKIISGLLSLAGTNQDDFCNQLKQPQLKYIYDKNGNYTYNEDWQVITEFINFDKNSNCIVDSCENFYQTLDGQCQTKLKGQCQTGTVACSGILYTCVPVLTGCQYEKLDNAPAASEQPQGFSDPQTDDGLTILEDPVAPVETAIEGSGMSCNISLAPHKVFPGRAIFLILLLFSVMITFLRKRNKKGQ